jgi:lysozyme
MNPTSDCLDLIKEFEGCRLEAYRCPAGKLTVGYGHTTRVYTGQKITPIQADAFLVDDVRWAADAVNRLAPNLQQHQFDAVVSFVFNVGENAFKTSTLLSYLKRGLYAKAGGEFPRYVWVQDKISPGLQRRRAAEAALFLRSWGNVSR